VSPAAGAFSRSRRLLLSLSACFSFALLVAHDFLVICLVVLEFGAIPCYGSDRGGSGMGRRRTDLWNPGEPCEEEPSGWVGV